MAGSAAIASMTGFARAQGDDGTCRWAWEARSVNSRGLDIRCRMPPGFDEIEIAARERVQRRFARGSVGLTLQVERTASGSSYRINPDVIGEIARALPELAKRVPDARPPSLDGLLSLKGVFEPVEDATDASAREARLEAILATLDTALGALAEARLAEGKKLARVLADQVGAIAALADEARALAADQPANIRAKLLERIAQLGDVGQLPEERLAQEVMLAATKADVREELDRLGAHVQAARALLAEGGAAGRRLDFLCQEFNREANTLCSKAADIALSRVGLALKAAIDQMREQIQNVE